MSKQAKVLTQQEIRRVLDYVATRPHAERNRAMFLTMLYAMLRVKECAALRYADVLDAEGKIKAEFYLSAEQTKGRKGGTVFVSDRACPRFCVNGLIAGNCLHLQRKRNDRKQRTDRPPAGGLQKT